MLTNPLQRARSHAQMTGSGSGAAEFNPQHHSIRQREKSGLRPAHREYAKDLMARGKLAAAGPFTDGSGALFISEAETLQEAELLAAEDPFSKGGAFASCTVARWQILGANHRLLVPDNRA